ncbi:TIGR03086 family metal-binding protein [Streptomyces sp. NPDC005438]|uniref:TIGR03086 family metal-binding protein n=1 Tax=Streptomyces sp. NPDC005438 TaxID=3156880 RepID=UPI00339E1B9C
MNPQVDPHPLARQVAQLLPGVSDDQLDAPTPCEDYPVAALLAHLLGLSRAFRDAARKENTEWTATDPGRATPVLDPRWRDELPRALREVADAWRDPEAWRGETQAGAITLPGEVAGQVAVNELLVHGWDLARATGQRWEPDESALQVSYGLLGASTDPEGRSGMFGPVVPVPDTASLLDRAVGLSGRDPGWAPNGRT